MQGPVRLFIDGGARGNPGPAGFGVHIEDAEGRLVGELYGFLGRATNNVAEYAGLLAALEWVRDQGVREVRLASDSQLLVRQFNGEYRVKAPGLKPLHRRARALAAGIDTLSVVHVRREQNTEADALANRAMDEEAGNTPSPLPV